MGNRIKSRLQALERTSSMAPEQITITFLDGSKQCVMWNEAVLAVLNDEVIEVEGSGDMYGLCLAMLNNNEQDLSERG